MIKLERFEVMNFENAMRGARNRLIAGLEWIVRQKMEYSHLDLMI